jgi:type VII secretion protein EccE
MAWLRNDRHARGRDAGQFVPGPASRGAGRIGIAQVVLWEATLLVAGTVALRPVGTARIVGLVVASLLMVAMVVATAVPVRGRWLYEWALIRLRLRRSGPRPARSAVAPQVSVAAPGQLSGPGSGPAVAPDVTAAINLPALDGAPGVAGASALPTLEILEVTDRAGARHGLVRVTQGWAAVLQVPTDHDVVSVGEADLVQPAVMPWSVLAAALDDRGVRLQAVQVVRLVSAAPTVGFEQPGPLVESYALRAGGAPCRQRLYVALRLRPQDCPQAVAARGGGDEGAARALISAVARLRQQLSRHGIQAAPLNREQVEFAVRTVLSASAQDAVANPTDPRGWKAWYADGRSHVAFALSRWSAATDPAALLAELEAVPVSACITSTTLVQSPHRPVSLSATVRLVCSPDDRDRVRTMVAGLCRARRVVALPLDGEHRRAALATLPLAGIR